VDAEVSASRIPWWAHWVVWLSVMALATVVMVRENGSLDQVHVVLVYLLVVLGGSATSGRPLGVLHGTRVQKLPSAHRPADAWFHVSLVFVTQDARGLGIGRRLLEALVEWAEADGVTRVQLNAVPEARALYERMGFGPPSERLMELRVSDRSPR